MPSENVTSSTTDVVPDRRGRKRAARREALLEQAAEVVAEAGVDGLTMAALAEVSDYAPASLYTYFPSRSALIAALQQRALMVLAEFARDSVEKWDSASDAGSDSASGDEVSALARLWAFSGLFLTAPDHHPREFALQQQLLVSPGAEEVSDAARVVPVAMSVLEVPRQLLTRARSVGAINGDVYALSPLGDQLDVDVLRTFSWVTSLNGALLTDGLATGLPTTGLLLGSEITRALLIGWGADPALVEQARLRALELGDAVELGDPVADKSGPKSRVAASAALGNDESGVKG